jgi:hypothetical protein
VLLRQVLLLLLLLLLLAVLAPRMAQQHPLGAYRSLAGLDSLYGHYNIK